MKSRLLSPMGWARGVPNSILPIAINRAQIQTSSSSSNEFIQIGKPNNILPDSRIKPGLLAPQSRLQTLDQGGLPITDY